jgi:hypothetical protein
LLSAPSLSMNVAIFDPNRIVVGAVKGSAALAVRGRSFL